MSYHRQSSQMSLETCSASNRALGAVLGARLGLVKPKTSQMLFPSSGNKPVDRFLDLSLDRETWTLMRLVFVHITATSCGPVTHPQDCTRSDKCDASLWPTELLKGCFYHPSSHLGQPAKNHRNVLRLNARLVRSSSEQVLKTQVELCQCSVEFCGSAWALLYPSNVTRGWHVALSSESTLQKKDHSRATFSLIPRQHWSWGAKGLSCDPVIQHSWTLDME